MPVMTHTRKTSGKNTCYHSVQQPTCAFTEFIYAIFGSNRKLYRSYASLLTEIGGYFNVDLEQCVTSETVGTIHIVLCPRTQFRTEAIAGVPNVNGHLRLSALMLDRNMNGVA